ncbi:uncharacterized protein [Physcomitrium patens]|uniref:Glycine cleavage system H protein n=1 Tax=Physcomitrium patens TaxID=3218 RepID=A9SST6_PHYPA|nr:uncharacterized protein LOC112285444 [Physcomitrium patens]PNR49758.1 hypothetical protein PHYPA_011654 [Physcomitrium patens]|eukprot:XP_024382051.1 uncharacterized protein LOC112285444 [Physcomitrella patens]
MAQQLLRPWAVRSASAFRQTMAPFFQRFSTATVVDNLRYSKSHEWTRLEGDTAVVGITHHAQEALGDVVFVDLPEVGKAISQGDSFGSVESVKAVSDVYSPVSGEVVEVNSELTESPGLVNKGPFEEGWMMKLKLKDPAEVQSLLTAESYKQYIEEEGH